MEALGDPLVQGPRFSLRQHAHMLERAISSDMSTCVQAADEERQKVEDAGSEGGGGGEGGEEEDMDDGGTEFSFEFLSSVTIDLPEESIMLSAEKLFLNGKLRPLQAEGSVSGENLETENEGGLHQVETDAMGVDANGKENECFALAARIPCGKESKKGADLHMNLPTVKTSLHDSLALAKEQLRSLHENPRCLSMTIEGSRGHRHRSCVSLNSSRCSSPSRSRPPGTFSQPSTRPTSPKAHLSHKNRKFLQFFKLKKHLTSSKETVFPSSEGFSASSSSRLSRTLWPFSRSNSAGERKSAYAFSPLPRRSNSASESKTTSSTLLPNNPMRCDSVILGKNTTASLALSARKLQAMQSSHQQVDRDGLPPLPNANQRRTSPCFVPVNCGSDSVALSHPLAEGFPCTPTSTSRTSTSTASPSLSQASEEVSHVSRAESSPVQSGDSTHTHTHTHTQSLSSISSEFKAASNLGRHMRHASATNAPMRSVTRGSPTRQWSNPNMGGSTRGGVQRFGQAPSRGIMRPKDALIREAVSVRVTPVLNVPVCMTPSAKSKLFNLGNLFSKREKVGQGYTMLVSADSQSGG